MSAVVYSDLCPLVFLKCSDQVWDSRVSLSTLLCTDWGNYTNHADVCGPQQMYGAMRSSYTIISSCVSGASGSNWWIFTGSSYTASDINRLSLREGHDVQNVLFSTSESRDDFSDLHLTCSPVFVPELGRYQIHVQIDAPFTPATLSNIHSFVLRVDTLREFFTFVNVGVLRRTITVSWNCICRYFYILFFWTGKH